MTARITICCFVIVGLAANPAPRCRIYGADASDDIDENAIAIITQVLNIMDGTRSSSTKLDIGGSRLPIENGRIVLPKPDYQHGYTMVVGNRCVLANGLRLAIERTQDQPALRDRLLEYFKPLRESLLLNLQKLHKLNTDWAKTGVIAGTTYYPAYEYSSILEFLSQEVTAGEHKCFVVDKLYTRREDLCGLASHAYMQLIQLKKTNVINNSSVYISTLIAEMDYIRIFGEELTESSAKFTADELVQRFGTEVSGGVEIVYNKKDKMSNDALRITNTAAMLGAIASSSEHPLTLSVSAKIRGLDESYKLKGGYSAPYWAAKSFAEAARSLPYLEVEIREKLSSRFCTLLFETAENVNTPYAAGGVGVPVDRRPAHLGFLLQTAALVLARNDVKRTAKVTSDSRQIILTSSESIPENTEAVLFFRWINGSRCRWNDVRHSVSGRMKVQKSTADASSGLEVYSIEVDNVLFVEAIKSGIEFDLWLVSGEGISLETAGVPITPE